MELQFSVWDEKRIRVILDTDAACEADDPFAIAHAVLSPKLIVKGIVAEHFAQPGSMRRSHDAVRRLMNAMHRTENVLYGEEYPLNREGLLSEGVAFMIEEALREDSHPLFILCLGALSNIARALEAAPGIAEKITIVTIGGHSHDIKEAPFREFNFGNDPDAANVVLGSRAEVWQIPSSVYGSLCVGLAELQRRVLPCREMAVKSPSSWMTGRAMPLSLTSRLLPRPKIKGSVPAARQRETAVCSWVRVRGCSSSAGPPTAWRTPVWRMWCA